MTMSEQRAREILGDRATWELHGMRKALTLPVSSFFNDDEDNERLEAVRTMLRTRRRR